MMRRLVISVLAGLLSVGAQQAGAFPGQTAEELIRALGPSANGYLSPPVPTVEAVRAGQAQLSRIYWPQAAYDPLRSGATLQGILVATFDYRGAGLVERLQKEPPEIGWKDLVSQSEVFLAFLSPQTFQNVLTAIHAGWTITAKTHQGAGAGYDLYSLKSKDGRFQGEMSYSEKGEVPPPPDPSGQQPPTLNFWARISALR
jgi:hypothetical protein